MLTFDEVLKPFTEEEAVTEAKRCLKCKNPLCVNGCPIKNQIPQFINEVAEGNYLEAKRILDKTTNLSSICSRVCNHESQCIGNCILNKKGNPINVGKLERFVADFAYENDEKKEIQAKIGSKVALIGSGPASISCAKVLAENGIEAVIFEKEANFGGQLFAGIPEYRLKNEIVNREKQVLLDLGVEIFYNVKIGKDKSIEDLLNEYDYIFVGVGASEAKGLKINGVDLVGVHQASDFLKQVSEYQEGQVPKEDIFVKEGDKVIVIGGGNVAMDASRISKRFTDDVKIVYRRWREVMPASDYEYNESVHDNVEYSWRRTPIEFVGENGKVTGLKVLNTNDENNHFEEIVECDVAILAIGSNLDMSVFDGYEEPKLNEQWFLESVDSRLINSDRIFVGGDATLSPATVVEATKTGIEAGWKIIKEIQ